MLDFHPGVDVVVCEIEAAEGGEVCVSESTGGVDVVVAEGEFFELGEERGGGGGGSVDDDCGHFLGFVWGVHPIIPAAVKKGRFVPSRHMNK